MRPKVYVYAMMLDKEKLASYAEAVKSFDADSFNSVVDMFLEAAGVDSGADESLSSDKWMVFHDPVDGFKRLATQVRIKGWRSIKFNDVILYHPGPNSSLWNEISEEEFLAIGSSMPTPFEMVLGRPDLLNAGLSQEHGFGISLVYDELTGFVNIVSLNALENLPERNKIHGFSTSGPNTMRN